MKLIQIKEFNKKTVTKKIAAEICALCAWNHLNEPRFKNEFTITQGTPIGVLKKGGGSQYPYDPKNSHLYDKKETGVEIQIRCTNQRVRLWENGHLNCYYNADTSQSEYQNITRNRHTGKETEHDKLNYPPNPMKLIELYVKLGFYKVEL